MLVGISEEKYSEYMKEVTTVHKNIDLNSIDYNDPKLYTNNTNFAL